MPVLKIKAQNCLQNTINCVTSAERGETISVITCTNAEGNFLLPNFIFKGKRKKENLKMAYHLEVKSL